MRPNTTDFQFVNYTYEKAVKIYIEQQLPAVHHFIDIGACIGEYCVWLAGKGIPCTAFEPVNYLGAEENIRLNNVGAKVDLHRCGLGSQKAKVYFNALTTVTGSSRIDRDRNDGKANIHIGFTWQMCPVQVIQNR